MQLLRNQSGHVARSLLIGMIGIIIPAIVMIVVYKDRKVEHQQPSVSDPQARVAPRISETLPTEKLGGKELELFRLPGPLSQAPIYSIVVDGRTIWLGTGKGLIRFNPNGTSKLYRNFSLAQNEWIRSLTLADGKLAASIMIAPGNTGGTPVGSFQFDPATESWQRIGLNARSLAWDGDKFWTLKGRTLSTLSREPDGSWRQQEVATQNRLCSSGDLVIANNKIWIAQQGVVRHTGGKKSGASWAKEVPCGVLQIDPVTGRETLFEQKDGLASGFGRAIVADDNELWVAHSIKGDGLSQFTFTGKQWASLPTATNGQAVNANSLGLSARAIWLATPDGSRPLVRLDRESYAARSIAEAPPEHYVTAIAGRTGQVWVAMSKKFYDLPESGDYRVETVLGRLYE